MVTPFSYLIKYRRNSEKAKELIREITKEINSETAI